MKRLLLISLLVPACSSGHWVDADPLSSSIICADPAQMAKENMKPDDAKKAIEMFSRQACGKNGGTFTGDSRCQNGGGQIKCNP